MSSNSQAHRSPSLSMLGDSGALAYELKFMLDHAQAQQIEDWARRRLALDPHGDPALAGAYRTTTLYLDTPDLDVYLRTPSYGRRKFRVRRYGLTSWVYLERKSKAADRVSKRRAQVPEPEVALLADAKSPENWPGQWFHQRVLLKGLRPAGRVTYCRTAYVGECREGPLRLTVDRDIRGVLTSDWRVLADESPGLSLTDHVILELKFLRAVPQPFKDVVRDFRLTPAVVSKYRLCREACGGAGGVAAHREVARA